MKKRDCYGEYDKHDTFCVESCPDAVPCLRLKARVLLSSLPTDYKQQIEQMKVGEQGAN